LRCRRRGLRAQGYLILGAFPNARRRDVKNILSLSSAAAIALIATPTFAQNYPPSQTQSGGYFMQQAQPDARGAYGQSFGNFGPHVVIEGGQVIGADPDPNVRLELRREYESSSD
jgi:hypothetical protein